MIDLSGIWLLGGAIVPALLGSSATYPNYWLNKLACSSLLSLATVVIAAFEVHIELLLRPMVLFNSFQMPLIQFLTMHFGAIVVLNWLFQVIATKVRRRVARDCSIVLIMVLALVVTGHAILVHNYFILG